MSEDPRRDPLGSNDVVDDRVCTVLTLYSHSWGSYLDDSLSVLHTHVCMYLLIEPSCTFQFTLDVYTYTCTCRSVVSPVGIDVCLLPWCRVDPCGADSGGLTRVWR